MLTTEGYNRAVDY